MNEWIIIIIIIINYYYYYYYYYWVRIIYVVGIYKFIDLEWCTIGNWQSGSAFSSNTSLEVE